RLFLAGSGGGSGTRGRQIRPADPGPRLKSKVDGGGRRNDMPGIGLVAHAISGQGPAGSAPRLALHGKPRRAPDRLEALRGRDFGVQENLRVACIEWVDLIPLTLYKQPLGAPFQTGIRTC